MSEWHSVTHREECKIRAAEAGETVSTLAGPQYPNAGDFVLRRRHVPHNIAESDTDELAKLYASRYQGAAPLPESDFEDEESYRDYLYGALGFGWEDRVADEQYGWHHFRMEDIDLTTEDDPDVGLTYWDQTNDYLKDEIVRRENEGREIHINPPGNKAELVAALEADDADRTANPV